MNGFVHDRCDVSADAAGAEPDRAASHRYPPARPFLFLHIPKTAGTSILAVLGNTFGERRVRRLKDREVRPAAVRKLLRSPALAEIDCLVGHFPVHAFGARLVEFQAFTVLRHPVERVMSLYRFLRCQRSRDLASLGLRRGFTLAEFMTSRSPELYGQLRNGMCRMLCDMPALSDHRSDRFWQEQLPPRAVARSLATLQRIEFGIAEEMPDTLALLRMVLGLSFEPAAHRENVSGPSGPERRTANLLKLFEMNAADLALYHEARALFGSRIERLRAAAADSFAVPGGCVRLLDGIAAELRDIPARQGFHPYEPRPGFAWVVGAGPARLAFAAAPGRVRLRLHAYRVAENYPVGEIGLAVNGVAVAHQWRACGGQWGLLETEPFTAAAQNVLALSAPYAVPTRFLLPESRDKRQLSIAVATLMLRRE